MKSKTWKLRRPARVTLVLVMALLLRADSCSTTERTVQAPVQFTVQFDVDVSMNTAVDDTVTTLSDLAGPMLDALADLETDEVPDAVYWVGMSATFTRNDGFDTTRDLRLRVGEPGATVLLAQTPTEIPDNQVGTTALVAVSGGVAFDDTFQLDLLSSGVGIAEIGRIASEALEEYRSSGDIAARDMALDSIWANARSLGDAADDFTLRVRLNFQMLDEQDVDVYAP